MFFPKWSMAATCVALTLALALGVDWVAAELLAIGSPQVRWWLLTTTLALVAAALAFRLGRERTLRRQATQDAELLGRSGPHQMVLAGAANVRPADDWNRAFARLQERMSGMARRLEELDRERDAYEHRAKSFESQSRQVHSVLSALAEPVLVIDKRDNLVLTNSSAQRLLSIKSDGEQRALDSLVHCERLVELLTDTRRRQAFTQRSCEIELADEQGAAHWYRVTARNIPTQPGDSDPDGTSQGAVALMHDISAQRVLQKRNAEFVTAVSHEMKTPLSGIKAYVELLTDGEADDPQAQQEFLRVIAVQANRLQHLVDDLVELARIEADLGGEQKREQPLVPLLEDALAAVRSEALQKDLHLETDWSGQDLNVLVDRPLMYQAAYHLLSNAVRYTPAGGRITLRARAQGRDVAFEVADTGVGIPAEDCPKIFEKFYRAASAKQICEGTGLGLPLVKHIVEDVHGGLLELNSKPGEGSVFRVLLANPAAAN
jgi:two-component system, OmpR family, phosphate regulon sensor histidine kinase PhoR